MFILFILTASLLIALLRGGRIQNLAHMPVRYIGLLFVPLLLQIIAFSAIGDVIVLGSPLARFLHIASLGLTALVLWFNRGLPGATWIALGLILNFLVISLNGGFMPVSAAAREFAGMPLLLERTSNVIPLTDSTALPFLSDILPLPAFMPFSNVFSIGDVLIAIGGVIFTQRSLLTPQSGGQNTG